MRKATGFSSGFDKRGLNYIIDQSLNELKGKNLAPLKLAEANKMLKKIKGPLPDSFKSSNNP